MDYLGKGARSTIWRVRERNRNRYYAVKRVTKQPGDDDRFFGQAINEFEKFLMHEPQDDEVRLYLSKSYFQQGLVDYNKGDFMAAKNGFEMAASNDVNCDRCSDYVEKSVASFKEAHYNKGIVYYNNEQLSEAISEWELVHEIDPTYKDVEQYLGQARKLLEKLEKIKKSSQ